MNTLKSKIAIGLFSGGLDSILSAMLIKEQGYNVKLLHFTSVFFGKKQFQDLYDMDIIYHQMGDEYIDAVIINPKHGYGKAINACIDCHAYMFKIAGEYMKQLNADFVFSGEVLGQRPMSQHRAGLDKVEKQSQISGFLLRPLSAKLLKPTQPELNGLIDRNLLMDIQGRDRSKQFELAKKFGINKFPQPAGGCRLTDQNLKTRFFDLKNRLSNNVTWDDLELMCFGRHLKLNDNYYLIIPRELSEVERIEKFIHKGLLVMADITVPGPKALLLSTNSNNNMGIQNVNQDILNLAASIVARYTKLYQEGATKILINVFNNSNDLIHATNATPLNDSEINKYRL